MNKIKIKKSNLFFTICKILPIVIIIGIAYFYFRDNLTLDDILTYTPSNIWLALLFIFILYIVKSFIVFIPITLLEIDAGFIFSTFTAIGINIIGAVVCFNITYVLGRLYSSSMIEKINERYPSFNKFSHEQKENEFFFSYLYRIICFAPADIISLYLGAEEINYRKYIIGSMLGHIPNLILVTILGESITDWHSPMFRVSVSLSLILTLVSFIIYRRYKKKKHN